MAQSKNIPKNVLEKIPKKVEDKSSEKGFQFEFTCDRCDTAYLSTVQTSAMETISNVLETASDLLGGILQQAATLGQQVLAKTGEKGREEALKEAVVEMAESFEHCPICSRVGCREKCWDSKKGKCKDCARSTGDFNPDTNDSSQSVSNRKRPSPKKPSAKSDDEKKKPASLKCPKCGKMLEEDAKFCPSCGAKISTTTKCPSCHAVLKPGAKFCSKCGEKIRS